jgi:hypothetical protein
LQASFGEYSGLWLKFLSSTFLHLQIDIIMQPTPLHPLLLLLDQGGWFAYGMLRYVTGFVVNFALVNHPEG